MLKLQMQWFYYETPPHDLTAIYLDYSIAPQGKMEVNNLHTE